MTQTDQQQTTFDGWFANHYPSLRPAIELLLFYSLKYGKGDIDCYVLDVVNMID